MQGIRLHPLDSQARRHCMAATLDQFTRRHGRPHRATDIDACNRPQRPRTRRSRYVGRIRFPSNHTGRTLEPVHEPRRHQADQPLMPSLRPDQDQRGIRVRFHLCVGHRRSLLQHGGFQFLALLVQLVKDARNPRRLDGIMCCE